MIPEIALLRRMVAAGAVMVSVISATSAILSGSRIGVSVALGGLLAIGILTITASGAALFGKAGDRAVPLSYAIGFFVKMGLLSGAVYALNKTGTISLVALALSLAFVYLGLLIVGVASSNSAIVASGRPTAENGDSP
jgi:ethanolamine utilization microcompartment shell protein EutS